MFCTWTATFRSGRNAAIPGRSEAALAPDRNGSPEGAFEP
jgi:hypothetical protein